MLQSQPLQRKRLENRRDDGCTAQKAESTQKRLHTQNAPVSDGMLSRESVALVFVQLAPAGSGGTPLCSPPAGVETVSEARQGGGLSGNPLKT